MNINVVIYARYSSDKQREESIEGQLRVCNAFAEANGYTVIHEYCDRALSGTTDRRPEFQQMIEDAKKREFQFIIVWKLDRFARNRYDSAIYKTQLKKYGVKVLSATEGIGEGDESLILEAVLEAMAELYSKQLSQNVKRGMRENALKAKSTGGTIPLGYMLENGKIIENPSTAPIVKKIFEWYNSGVPKQEIANRLNAQGARSTLGNEFTVNSFTTILKNEKYAGVYHYEDIREEGAVPPLITKEAFEKAQELTEQRRRGFGRYNEGEKFLLTGKMFCGYCGEPMIGDSGTSKTGERHKYYSCAGRKNRHNGCKKHREKKGFIEWYIVEQTCLYILAPERIGVIAERVTNLYNQEFSEDKQKEAEKRLKRLNKEMSDLADSLIGAKSKKLIDSINDKAEQLEAQIIDAERDCECLKATSKKKLKAQDVEKWLQSFCKGEATDAVFREKIIDALVNAVYLFDDKVVIYWNVKGGKQVSWIDMSDDIEDESSLEVYDGSPEKTTCFDKSFFQ